MNNSRILGLWVFLETEINLQFVFRWGAGPFCGWNGQCSKQPNSHQTSQYITHHFVKSTLCRIQQLLRKTTMPERHGTATWLGENSWCYLSNISAFSCFFFMLFVGGTHNLIMAGWTIGPPYSIAYPYLGKLTSMWRSHCRSSSNGNFPGFSTAMSLPKVNHI